MGWVRRQKIVAVHKCKLPMHEVTYSAPAPPPLSSGRGPASREPIRFNRTEIDGQCGDLWRCGDCGRLWCVVNVPQHIGGYRPSGVEWQPATAWQRLRHRKDG